MKVTLGDLIVKVKKNSLDMLTENWIWLISDDKAPILVSTIGDMFLTDSNDKVYWLDVGGGKLTQIANGIQEFKEKLKDINQVNEWFMIDLTTELKLSGKELKEGQVYSYKKLPILGGEYSLDNFEPMDIEVHFCFAGQIHKQLKDLPDGTRIDEIKFV
jgi:hypothetical protein